MDPIAILALLGDLHQTVAQQNQLLAQKDQEIDQLRIQLLPEAAKESPAP